MNDRQLRLRAPGTTCDESGFFTAKWTPPVPGTYVVTAKFEGDQYFSASSAKTTFIVAEAAATPAPVSTDEIVRRVIAAFPSVPAGFSADEVAQKVLANLPANPSSQQIAQEVANQLSTKPASTPVEPTTTSIILIAGIIAAIAIGIANLLLIRKRK